MVKRNPLNGGGILFIIMLNDDGFKRFIKQHPESYGLKKPIYKLMVSWFLSHVILGLLFCGVFITFLVYIIMRVIP